MQDARTNQGWLAATIYDFTTFISYSYSNRIESIHNILISFPESSPDGH